MKTITTKDKVIYSQVIKALINSDSHVKQGLQFMEESIGNKIFMKNTTYQRAIEVLFNIIEHKVVHKNIGLTEAKQFLQIIMKFVKSNTINLRNIVIQKVS
jgi:hypothetical protein